jgi:hypothetical protein
MRDRPLYASFDRTCPRCDGHWKGRGGKKERDYFGHQTPRKLGPGMLSPPLSALLLILSGCTRLGYGINLSITAPVAVQQMFSASQPGLVADRDDVLGRLCAPLADDVTFQLSLSDANFHCEDKRSSNDIFYGHAFVFDEKRYAPDSMSPGDRQALACGNTGSVRQQDGAHLVTFSGLPAMVGTAGQVASGDALGTCGPDGNYYLAIVLAAP